MQFLGISRALQPGEPPMLVVLSLNDKIASDITMKLLHPEVIILSSSLFLDRIVAKTLITK